MRHKIILLFTLFLLCCSTLLGQPVETTDSKVNIGYLDTFKVSDQVIILNDISYPIYTFLDTLYIPLNYIEAFDNDHAIDFSLTLDSTLHTALTPSETVYLEDLDFYTYNTKVHVLRNGEYLFIPLSSLWGGYNLTYTPSAIRLEPKPFEELSYVHFTDTSIVNQSTYPVTFTVLDLIWNGKVCIEHERIISLEPNASCPKTDFLKDFPESSYYLTSFVTQLNGLTTSISETLVQDLKNNTLYKTHFDNQAKCKQLDKLFQPTYIQATLKYSAGGLQHKESVNILWAEKKKYYVVQSSTGKEHTVPWGSLEIEGKSWYPPGSVTDQDIEDYANIHALTSDTDYFVWTDVGRHRTYVLKKQDTRWHLEKNFICATGKDKNPTPSGTFKLEYTLPYFGMDHGFQCKNAIVFFRDFMYHSVLFDKGGNYVIKSQLGSHASSGCVRLSVEDSKWLYDNVPMTTTVWIH